MEELERRESQGESWNLHSDKALLTALQELSSDIMASIGRLDSGLKSLEASTRTLTTRTGNASALFKDLCQSQFIEQVAVEGRTYAIQYASFPMFGTSLGELQDVAQPSTVQETESQSNRHPALMTSDFRKVVHNKYKEALHLASIALQMTPAENKTWPLLPHVFGSPEYLQDATSGIRGEMAGELRSQPSMSESRETPAVPFAGDVPDVPLEEDISDEAVPDFRSMLEAALRGDFNDGLDGESQEELAAKVVSGSDSPSQDADRHDPDKYLKGLHGTHAQRQLLSGASHKGYTEASPRRSDPSSYASVSETDSGNLDSPYHNKAKPYSPTHVKAHSPKMSADMDQLKQVGQADSSPKPGETEVSLKELLEENDELFSDDE